MARGGASLTRAVMAMMLTAGDPELPTLPRTEFVVRAAESGAAAPPGLRSATIVRVRNGRRGDSCEVDVTFGSGGGRCVVRETLRPGQRRGFCSRAVDHPLVGCSASCPAGSSAGGGDARVSSSCDDVEVSAQVVYTRGDREWEGVSDLTVTPVPPGPRRAGG